MKILVTGATGFVGSHIAERLAADGHDVRVLLRATSSRRFLEGVPFEAVEGDLTDAASLGPAARGVDAVIHAAGLVKARSVREFQAVNAQGTGNLLAAVEREAPGLTRFVYVSSIAAHGPSPGGAPRPLDAAPAPVSVYGRAKAEGEALVRRSPLADRAVMLRLPGVYGPRDFEFLTFFRLAKLRLAPLLHGGRNTVSIIYVEDAAQAAAASPRRAPRWAARPTPPTTAGGTRGANSWPTSRRRLDEGRWCCLCPCGPTGWRASPQRVSAP